jgi:hypothetical protein
MNRSTFNRKTFPLLLLIASLASLGYAIYRSTDRRVTISVPGSDTVYGEPQHGLLLGMCIFAGICLLGIVLLFRDNVTEVKTGTNLDVNRDQLKTSSRTATNYPK